MTKNKRIISLFSALIMLLNLAACSDAGTESESSHEVKTGETQPHAETERVYADDITDDVTFNGAKVNILWMDITNYADEYNGQVANDAMYDRELSVENRLNVDIQNINGEYKWDTREQYITKIKSSHMANDDSYNIVQGEIPYLIIDGILYDLNTLNYLDFDKPYWANDLVEELSIDGRLYAVNGDFSGGNVLDISCIWYNEVLRQNLNLEDPMVLVDEGKWTAEKLYEMASAGYMDADGSGKLSINDQFGLIIREANALTPFISAFGLRIASKNADGVHELTFNNEKVISAFEFMLKLLGNYKATAFGGEGGTKYNLAFNENRGIFVVGQFSDAPGFVEMENEVGILPLPKFDENQETYLTKGSGELYGITTSTSNVPAASAVMELMASEGYRIVTPALYETNLKTRYSTDPDMARMFDVIRSGITVDFGEQYGWYLEGISAFWKIQVADRGNWASKWKAVEGLAQEKLNELYEIVNDID